MNDVDVRSIAAELDALESRVAAGTAARERLDAIERRLTAVEQQLAAVEAALPPGHPPGGKK